MPKQSSRILFAGESWSTYAVHTKGANSYTTSAYEEGAKDLLAALASPASTSPTCEITKPRKVFLIRRRRLASRFDVVVLSDIPADSLLLPHAVFVKGEKRPNRLRSLAKFVERGGGLLMVGGYMSFAGFEGRARYASTPLAEALPVEISHHDDRVEEPEGVNPVVARQHPDPRGVSGDWPYFLGYNRFKAKAGSEVICRLAKIHFW